MIPVYDSESVPSSSVDQQPPSRNPEPLRNATANQYGYATLNALEPIVTESSALLNPPPVYDDNEEYRLGRPCIPLEVVALPPPHLFSHPSRMEQLLHSLAKRNRLYIYHHSSPYTGSGTAQ